MTKKQKLKLFEDICFLVIGSVLMAIAYVVFTAPLQIVSGGVGGLAIILKQFIALENQSDFENILISALMVLLFLLGLITQGKKFALRTLPATIIYPGMISLLKEIPLVQTLAADIGAGNILIGAIFGGACFGIGIGLILIAGGSSGGFDATAFIISKKYHFKIDRVIFFQDAIIIASGVFIVGFEEALVGILLSYVSMIFTDKIMIGTNENIFLLIISDKYEEINDFIINKLERGSTIVPAIGGFTKKAKNEIQVVINKRDYIEFKNFTKGIDPTCFITVIRARDVYGEGFNKMDGD